MKNYEWHPGDKMSLRAIIVEKMSHSKFKFIKRLGWKWY